MPRKSKSRTTTRPTSKAKEGSRPYTAGRRLPRHRPPTHPGEMILEEFLTPLKLTQTELDFGERRGSPTGDCVAGLRLVHPAEVDPSGFYATPDLAAVGDEVIGGEHHG